MRWIKAWKQFHKHIAAHQNLSGAIIAFHGQRLYSSWRVMIFFCSVKVMKAILMAVTRVCTWKRFMNEWCSPAQREKKPLYMFTPPTLLVGIPWKEEKVPPWSEGTYFSSIHVQPMPSPKKNRKEKKVKHRRGATEKKTVSNNIINLETIMIYCDGNWKHSFVGARQTVIFVF